MHPVIRCYTHILPFLLLTFFGLHAQDPTFNFQKFGSEEGLNNANIFNIAQQSNGLIYLTTQNGIYSYDGYNFKLLAPDSLKNNGLLFTTVREPDELHLSVRSEGLAVFNLSTRTFSRTLRFNNTADNIIIGSDYAYLLSTGIRLQIADLRNGKIADDALAAREKLNRPLCIFQTREGKILTGRSDGLYEVKAMEQVKLPLPVNEAIHAITQRPDGSIVLGTSGRILIVDGEKLVKEITPIYKTRSFTFQLGGEKSVNKVLADSYGRIWFTSYPDDRLYLYQNDETYDVFDILDLPGSLINCLYLDDRENVWVGTFNEGLFYVQNSFFNSLSFIYDNGALKVNQVYLKNNLLVAATGNGLYGLNLTNNQGKVLSKPDAIPDPVNNIAEREGVLYYSKSNPFYLAPSMFFDSRNAYKLRPVVARHFYPLNNQQSVLADNQADILLASADGSEILDTLISFPDYRISVNAFLKNGDSLFIATNSGLYVYSFRKKKYSLMVRSELNYPINDLVMTNGLIYAAHEAGVTDVYNRRLIGQVGNFHLNGVKRICLHAGRIWLATLDGVYLCNPDFDPLQRFTRSNGLPSGSVTDIAFNDEMVAIATARGVAIARLQNVLDHNAKLPPVTIDYVTAGSATLSPGDEGLNLNADQEDVTVYFLSPWFNRPNKQIFRYRLDNGDWKTFNELSISMQLKGGSHRLEISASADQLTWSDPTLLLINKAEKLSEKQSTYLLSSLAGLLFVGGLSFLRIRYVKAKARKRLEDEKQINQLKHQAMNSLLSPHFIFNSLTSIQNYINTNNSLKASEYLAKFSRLIRMIIEKASQSDIALHDELARLTYYLELEKERFKNKFDYEIHIDDAIHTHELRIPNMIVQPHVENCIIHGILPKQEHGTLHISFKKPNTHHLVITIEDNGIGLIKAAEHAKTGHKSLGTSTIRNILEINSKLTGKRQKVTMLDKSTLDPSQNGTIITLELEL